MKKTNNKTESNLYRLDEMHDAMVASIENARKVRAEQLELLEVVKACDKHEKFESFIKDTLKENDELGKQIETLEKRASILQKVIDVCRDNKLCQAVVDDLLLALGVFTK